MNIGDVSGAFAFFSHAMNRYRTETAAGCFTRFPGNPWTTCPMGIDEATYGKLVMALVKETHADHASEVARAMASFGFNGLSVGFNGLSVVLGCLLGWIV